MNLFQVYQNCIHIAKFNPPKHDACTMGGDGDARLVCLCLEGRSEPPDETNSPFRNIRFISMLQNKEEPMHCYKPYTLSRPGGICYFPKAGCGGLLHPVPWGQLLSWGWPMARKVACSALTNQLPRGLCGAVWWSRGSGGQWITVPRVKNKVTTVIHINQKKRLGGGGQLQIKTT